MNEKAPDSFATTDGKNEPANLQGSHGSANSRSSAEIHDRTGLYISILALALAGIALGLWLNQAQIIEAKVQAGIAKADATAHAADTNARVALDDVEQLQIKLAEKGIKVSIH